MSATSGNASETIIANNQTLLNINMSNVTKLTLTNYLMWKLQVNALLDGYALADHLHGSATIPPNTISVGDVTSENPDYVTWKCQDKLIYSALLGTISLAIQPILSRTTTACDIWSTLAQTYAKPSRGHIRQLKLLKNWTKGSSTIDRYLQGFTTGFDNLATLGKPNEDEDQIEMILEGLPDDYTSVVDQVEGRDTPPTIVDLHERLLNHEAKLLSAAVSPSVPATANMAQQHTKQQQLLWQQITQQVSQQWCLSATLATDTTPQQQPWTASLPWPLPILQCPRSLGL
ncbi:unnamed protein product [Microthlaspi erraticum]|uniref:Retrotransposon Copia-like N-terminal domain-containing protein n=1 Tax=Microthlaspi erraticum TaxID=1685480 RepID=A0A6D2IW41_9BRAS|nr:unnamed protein product [Microthlaspi erraticum]